MKKKNRERGSSVIELSSLLVLVVFISLAVGDLSIVVVR